MRELVKSDSKIIASPVDFVDSWNKSMIDSAFNGGRFYGFIEEENGNLKGFITFSIGLDDADIESVYVKKEFRKNKLATLLLESALEKIKKENITRVLLEVKEGNIPAISLYSKFGFKKISVRKKYYADGKDALIYLKEL